MSEVLPPAIVASLSLDDVGHRFRSKLLDHCAVAERWVNNFICDSRAGTKLKPRAPIGQRLRALREIAQRDQQKPKGERMFAKPARVALLLARFEIYAELRSALAHATQSVSIAPDGTPVFLYRPTTPRQLWQSHALTEATFKSILREAASLAKELSDQQAGERLSPSSPRPPKRAATADP